MFYCTVHHFYEKQRFYFIKFKWNLIFRQTYTGPKTDLDIRAIVPQTKFMAYFTKKSHRGKSKYWNWKFFETSCPPRIFFSKIWLEIVTFSTVCLLKLRLYLTWFELTLILDDSLRTILNTSSRRILRNHVLEQTRTVFLVRGER